MAHAQYDLDNIPTKRDWASILVTAAIACFSLIVSGWVAYSANDKATTSRISVVETQQKNDDGRLGRIEFTLDQMDAKIDHLLERR